MGYEATKSRYRQAGKAKGGATGTSIGTTTGAAIGTAIMPGVGTAVGAGVGALAGWLIGKRGGKKKGEAEGKQAFLSKTRSRISKRKTAEDKAQLTAMKASGGPRGRPVYSDDQTLSQNFSTVGSGGRHDAWEAATFGPTTRSSLSPV